VKEVFFSKKLNRRDNKFGFGKFYDDMNADKTLLLTEFA